MSGQCTVVTSILHYRKQSIVFDVEFVLVVVKQFILLHTLHLHPFQTEVPMGWVFLHAVERIEVNSIDQRPRFV